MRISDWSSDVCSSDLRMAVRRHRRIGDGRVVQVEREILRQHAMIVNVGQQPLIARAEQDHMVRYARPASPDAEMQYEQAGRPAFAGELFRLFLATRTIGRASCRERVCPYV